MPGYSAPEREDDLNRTRAGFEELAGEKKDDAVPKKHQPKMGDAIFGLDARTMAREELAKAMQEGDEKKIADIQRYIGQLDEAASRPRTESAPLSPASRQPEPQPFHQTENPVQFFGPEVSEQVRRAGENLRQKQEEDKGRGGWLRRLLGR